MDQLKLVCLQKLSTKSLTSPSLVVKEEFLNVLLCCLQEGISFLNRALVGKQE